MRVAAALALALALMFSPVASAHVASNGFLVVQVHGQQLSGSIELAVRDVELAIGVDANRDGKVSWGELRASEPQLIQYVAQHLDIGAHNSPCVINFQALQVNQRVDGNYAWLPFGARCALEVRQLSIRYRLMH